MLQQLEGSHTYSTDALSTTKKCIITFIVCHTDKVSTLVVAEGTVIMGKILVDVILYSRGPHLVF